ncbi:MAG TPA: MBG domain-containing protein, partial [Prolixibacteraceae bacterium]|nr:MBG domain-containing protein [Prolixibacteraceae bacterium]
NDTSKVYGESTPVLTVLYEGFVNGDDANDLSVKPVASVAAGDGINVGNYTITASGGVSSNYTFNYFTGNLEVAKALLTVTADDKVVCLNQAIPQLTISYSGFVNGDDETVLDIKPTAATTALLGSPAGSYPITVSGGSDDNYDFDYVAGTLKVSVVQVPVIVWPAPADIVYGTLLSAKQLNAVAKVGTDTISGTFTYTPSLGTRLAVGNSQPITVHFTPDNTTFYESASGNVSINVTKATLTVTANSQTKMYGSSNPELTYRCSGWVNGVETIDVEPTISTTITETTRVGTYSGSITLSGGSDNNYKLNLVSGDFSVTKATLTVTVDNQYKVYGEENPELTYTYHGWVNGIETVDKAPTLTTTVTRTTGSGSYLGAITASGASDDAYNFVYVPGYFAIDKAALTVTADNQTKVYGSSNPDLAFTYRGWVNGVEAIDEAPTISTNVNAATDAGNYPDSIIVTGGSDNNYTFNYVAGDFEVTKALLTVKANDLISYYGEIINPTATITGFANGDDEAVIDVMPVASISGTAPRSMGNYTISCNGASDNNYDFRYADGTLTVNKAVLTAVADSQRISYGEIIPALTIRYEGFQYGDDKSILTTLPVASVESSAGENAGSYPITVSGGTAANYNFQYKSGVLTVDKALLTVTADSQAIVYGDTIPALAIRYEGFVNREDSTALELLPVAYLDTVGGSEITETLGAGIYPIVVSGGKATNYDFKYVGDTLTVTKALLTVKPNRQVITYGDKIPAFMIGYDGFVAGDTIADLDTLPVAAVDGIDWLDAGVYPVQVSGGWSKNYRFEYVNDTLVVEKSLLTVTADNKESLLKNIPELTFTYSGFVNGDSEASLDEVPVVSTSATTTSPAGIYSIEVSGGSDNNYEFTYEAGTLTIINKQIPVITWNTPAPIVYGSILNETQLNATTDVPGTFVYSPAEGGILNAGNEQPLVVTFIPDNTSNYVEVSDTVLIHVEKAVLTVTAVDQVINKGMEPSDFTLIYSGFVNGENLDVIDEVPVASTSANSESNSGTYAITVSGGLDNNYSFNYVNGTLTILSNVGIDVAKTIRVSVYPNPFTDRITVTTSSNVDGSYELTDNTGKVVGKGAIENGSSNLLLSTLRKGVYLLQVNFEEGKQVFRIVKSE